MPFVTDDRRVIIDTIGLSGLDVIELGDVCYYFYAPMVLTWRRVPRWTTAHILYKDMQSALVNGIFIDTVHPADVKVAYQLAWQVFFQLYVMPYELKKREENGDIE